MDPAVRLLAVGLRATAWCAALAAGGCLLAGLCGAVSPEADFLNQFAPVWSVLGLAACAVILALTRRRRRRRRCLVATLGLSLIAATAVLEGPELAARLAPGHSDLPREIRIVQFNLWKFNRSPARTAAWIAAQRADFVVLQEAAVFGGEVARALAPQYPFAVSCRGHGRCSTVILSRLPPSSSAGLAKGDPEDRKALSAGWARYKLGGREITIVAAHLARPWPWGRQDEDRRLLLAEMRNQTDQNLILVGDFNTTPWTFAGKRQDRALGMKRITRALFTWPVYAPTRLGVLPTLPILPIDQAYLRPGLLAVAVRRGPNLGSDHRPVVIDLAWAALRDQRIVE